VIYKASSFPKRAETAKKRQAGQDFWPALTANTKKFVPQDMSARYTSLIHKGHLRARGLGTYEDRFVGEMT
jgi:hypothetical protein